MTTKPYGSCMGSVHLETVPSPTVLPLLVVTVRLCNRNLTVGLTTPPRLSVLWSRDVGRIRQALFEHEETLWSVRNVYLFTGRVKFTWRSRLTTYHVFTQYFQSNISLPKVEVVILWSTRLFGEIHISSIFTTYFMKLYINISYQLECHFIPFVNFRFTVLM